MVTNITFHQIFTIFLHGVGVWSSQCHMQKESGLSQFTAEIFRNLYHTAVHAKHCNMSHLVLSPQLVCIVVLAVVVCKAGHRADMLMQTVGNGPAIWVKDLLQPYIIDISAVLDTIQFHTLSYINSSTAVCFLHVICNIRMGLLISQAEVLFTNILLISHMINCLQFHPSFLSANINGILIE